MSRDNEKRRHRSSKRRSTRREKDEEPDKREKREKSRRSAAAGAFKAQDSEASKALHAARSVTEEAGHKKGGDYLKSMVYGAMDGLITTFAVVSAVVGGDLPVGTVLVMGFANMLGDGVSMGVGDYLSSTAELEFAKMERAREMWECDNDLEAERQEMIELYEAKDGISKAEAEQVVAIISKDLNTFVDIMMVEELGIMPPDEDDSPAKKGLVTFGAFLLFGTIPLLPYVAHAIATKDPKTKATIDATFVTAIALTGLSMFSLGALTSTFTADHWAKAGGFTFLNGAVAAIASYLIAFLVSAAFGVDIC